MTCLPQLGHGNHANIRNNKDFRNKFAKRTSAFCAGRCVVMSSNVDLYVYGLRQFPIH